MCAESGTSACVAPARGARPHEPARARRARPPDQDLHARRGPKARRASATARARRSSTRAWSPTASSTSSTRSSGSSWRCGISTRLCASRSSGSRTSSSTSVPTCRCRTPRTTTGSASRRRRSTSSSASATSTTKGLPELKSFVLPGGSEAAARLHVARAVCRRAELATIAAAREVELDSLVPIYLNRLSDLLFILARASNDGDEPLWRPGV